MGKGERHSQEDRVSGGRWRRCGHMGGEGNSVDRARCFGETPVKRALFEGFGNGFEKNHGRARGRKNLKP